MGYFILVILNFFKMLNKMEWLWFVADLWNQRKSSVFEAEPSGSQLRS